MTFKSGWCVWVTGLPGSGKSVVAKALQERLQRRNIEAQILSSDALRKAVTPKPRYTEEERDMFYSVLVLVAKYLTENGINVIRFQERETLDFYVSTGHYVFKRGAVEKLFREKGDFEFTAMQRLADKKMLQGYTYHGMWFTLNTMKDLMDVRRFFKE